MNDEKRVRTGFEINSFTGTCTQKLLATRLSFPFSISDSFFGLSSSTYSPVTGFILTVRTPVQLSAVTKLEYRDRSGVLLFATLFEFVSSEAGRLLNCMPKAYGID